MKRSRGDARDRMKWIVNRFAPESAARLVAQAFLDGKPHKRRRALPSTGRLFVSRQCFGDAWRERVEARRRKRYEKQPQQRRLFARSA